MRKRQTAFLLLLLLALSGGLFLLERTKAQVYKPHAPQMLEATARTRAAFEALRAERLRLGLAIDRADDPNDTGMIGDSYTEITTTLGALDAKRSTTNPNVAAMVVDMFTALGIGAGDRVAVNLSGSFPALNIAVLCAMDTLDIDGVVLFSVGASTYGATIPTFTYGDMEHFLHGKGLIRQRSEGFSLGGDGDLGLEMPEALRETIAGRLRGYGYDFLAYADFARNMEERMARYLGDGTDGAVACFVNVGGNLLSFGPDSAMHTVDNGILTPASHRLSGQGLVQRFLAADTPVIQLLNMKGLLPTYGLPVDPIPLPADGEGGVYWTQRYHPLLLGGLLGFACAGLAGYWLLFVRGKAADAMQTKAQDGGNVKPQNDK